MVALQVLVVGCAAKKEEKVKAEAAVQKSANEYPALTLTLENGQQISTRNLEGNNIFVFFQPDCDHCQQEATEIENQLDRFKSYKLYFISSGPMAEITRFARDYGLYEKQNVLFASTSTEGVLNHYGPIQTPSIYIYADGKLVKAFNGQTEVDLIIAAL
jgi:peroxiredoxin